MIKSVFIPTPGITEMSNVFLLQELIKERIKQSIIRTNFPSNFKSVVLNNLDYPPNFRTQEEESSWLEDTVRELTVNFNKIESGNKYTQTMLMLKEYEGWNITSLNSTLSGVSATITNSKEI